MIAVTFIIASESENVQAILIVFTSVTVTLCYKFLSLCDLHRLNKKQHWSLHETVSTLILQRDIREEALRNLENFARGPKREGLLHIDTGTFFAGLRQIQLLQNMIHGQRGMPISIAEGYLGWRAIGEQLAETSARCSEIMKLLRKTQDVRDASFSSCQEQLIQSLWVVHEKPVLFTATAE
ncbi:UNVERIFIED_CONTAM: hypothetical protein K2H54_054540 [Gekko kuhli]